MCLITVVPAGKKPDLEILAASRVHNDDGTGVAWIQDKRVHWIKGLKVADHIERVLAIVPKSSPIVIHDRLSTVGGDIPELTHPFIVGKNPTPLTGSTSGMVLFHNGHWLDWRKMLGELAIQGKVRLGLEGGWSDTRTLAALASIGGPGILDHLTTGQKFCLVTPKEAIPIGYGWETVDGIHYSNTLWQKKSYTRNVYTGPSVYSGKKGKKDNDKSRYEEWLENRACTREIEEIEVDAPEVRAAIEDAMDQELAEESDKMDQYRDGLGNPSIMG
jgi:hypothetical protein